MYISAIWNIKKRGSDRKYLFCLSFIRIYSRIHGANSPCCVVVKLFIEHLSVFLDMVNIKHNIEL